MKKKQMNVERKIIALIPTGSYLAHQQTGKNMLCYFRCSSVIVLRILGGIWLNMACAELGTSGPQNSRHTKESWRMSLVKLDPRCRQNGQTNQDKKIEKLVNKGKQTCQTSLKKVDTIFYQYELNKLCTISCSPSSAQSCTNLAQWCAQFGTSAWEGAHHSGWNFSIPTGPTTLNCTKEMKCSIKVNPVKAWNVPYHRLANPVKTLPGWGWDRTIDDL